MTVYIVTVNEQQIDKLTSRMLHTSSDFLTTIRHRRYWNGDDGLILVGCSDDAASYFSLYDSCSGGCMRDVYYRYSSIGILSARCHHTACRRRRRHSNEIIIL